MQAESGERPAIAALKAIAQGRLAGGSPLAAETARQAARDALIKEGISWRVPMAAREREGRAG